MRESLINISPSHPRIPDLKKLIDLIQDHVDGPCSLLETGTMRKDDLLSTLQWDALVEHMGGNVVTVDIDPDISAWARQNCSGRVTVLTGDSVATINTFDRAPNGSFDVAFLDSYDVKWIEPHASALHHLMELTALMPHLKPGALVAIDDNRFIQDIPTGKGLYIAKFMRQIGAELLIDGYIQTWRLPVRSQEL